MTEPLGPPPVGALTDGEVAMLQAWAERYAARMVAAERERRAAICEREICTCCWDDDGGRTSGHGDSQMKEPLGHAGMRVGVRYVVTRDSKHREFQTGDRVWMEPDGSIMCPAAQGWIPAEDVIEATDGWAIEPDANWGAAMRADLERQLAALKHA